MLKEQLCTHTLKKEYCRGLQLPCVSVSHKGKVNTILTFEIITFLHFFMFYHYGYTPKC